MTDGTGTTTYVYDALHRLTRDIQGDGQALSYGYDLAGNLTSLTYPNAKTVTRAYDAAGRLTSVTDWLGHTTSLGYDADSNPTAETYPNGVVGTFAFDAADRAVNTTDAKGATTLLSQAYSRDNTGLVTAENTTAYGYDGANRLTSSTLGPSPLAYNGADQITGLGTASLAYDRASELTGLTSTAGATTYAYDPEGDRTATTPPTGPAAAYSYDQAGRLTGFTQATTTAAYTYNGDGLRMAKKLGTATTRFAWDLAEGLPLTIQAGTTSYITSLGGLPVEQIHGTTVLYYAHDQLGSTRLLTNASGQTAGQYTYDPYGAVATHTGIATTPFGYAGQYTDAESGLIYLRARYYDPSTAQFLTVDPAVQSTRQPYTYGADSPIVASDPTGRQPDAQCSSFEGIFGQACTQVGSADASIPGGLQPGNLPPTDLAPCNPTDPANGRSYPYDFTFAGHQFVILSNKWAYDPTLDVYVPRDYTFGYWDGHTVYKLNDSVGVDINSGELVTAQTTDHWACLGGAVVGGAGGAAPGALGGPVSAAAWGAGGAFVGCVSQVWQP